MTLRADSLEKLPKTLLAKFLKGGKIGIFIKYIKTTWNFSTVFFHYLKLKLNNVQILKKSAQKNSYWKGKISALLSTVFSQINLNKLSRVWNFQTPYL